MAATKSNQPAEGKKMVKIKLFKDNHEYKDDVFVAVNGERYQIQRGKEVEVPDYIAEVLEHSAEQDARTAEFIEKSKPNTPPAASKTGGGSGLVSASPISV